MEKNQTIRKRRAKDAEHVRVGRCVGFMLLRFELADGRPRGRLKRGFMDGKLDGVREEDEGK